MWTKLVTLVIVVCVGCAYGIHEEKKLTKKILDNYEKVGLHGRPVMNTSASVPVSIRFSLIQVLNIDPEIQVFDFVGMVFLSWNDSLLTWNPSDHDDLQTLVFPWSKIWTPDIVIQNTIDAVKPFFQANAKVNFQGLVMWVMSYHFKTTCGTLPHQSNPQCKLKFGSWVHSEKELSLRIEKDRVDTSYYVPDHTWELQQTKAEKKTQEYSCCPDAPYGDVTYTLNFKRRHRPEDDEDKDKDSSALRISQQSLILVTVALVTTYLTSVYKSS